MRGSTKKPLRSQLKRLGIVLQPMPAPLANYVPFLITGNLLFISGQVPRGADGDWLVGKVGEGVTVEEAYRRARITGIRMLSVVESALGSLERVSRVVKILGFVNATPAFKRHPKVIDGCSDLMAEVFGEYGRHTRSAVGASSLAEDVTVEIEGIFEIRLRSSDSLSPPSTTRRRRSHSQAPDHR